MWIYNYKGFWNYDSKCGVEIDKESDKATVILTELEDNPGTSVTNMVEQLATMIYYQYLIGIPVDNITWIEHYPAEPEINQKETFDKVVMKWNGKKFSNPKWQRMKK